jgi:bacillithiol biosynthesis deacetylase BshB1
MSATNKVDILAIGVHPDDVELSCGGTLLKHVAAGKKAGILHLTKGELGTRGSADLRMKEARKAADLLGVSILDNAGMADAFFANDKERQLALIEKIRQYQPEIVLCNALNDRHPDHGRAARLIADSCFYAGLVKIVTTGNGNEQQPWRPRAVYHYIQDRSMRPDFVVDITGFFDKKMEAMKAYSSQFFDPSSPEPHTYISTPQFLDSIKHRCAEFGRIIGVEYAEGFCTERFIGVKDLFSLI